MGKKTAGIAERIRAELARSGLSQRAFHQRVAESVGPETRGVSFGAIRHYLSGKMYSPKPEVLQAMAEILGVRLEWLTTGRGERTEAEHRRRIASEFDESVEAQALREAMKNATAWHSVAGVGLLPVEPPTWLRRAYQAGEAPGWLSLPEVVRQTWAATLATFEELSPFRESPTETHFDRFHEEFKAALMIPFGFLDYTPDLTDPRVHNFLLTICHAYLQAAEIGRGEK